MGSLCSKHHTYNEADTEENAQQLPPFRAAEIERRIAQETKAEKHIRKILLLGAGESGKSTIFKQIKLLFQTGFDETELKSYISVIHANVYQTIKILHDGSKEFTRTDTETLKYVLSPENEEIGEKLSEIGSRMNYPPLTRELAEEIEKLWMDPVIQETCSRGAELQVPDCVHYFMGNLQRLSDVNYVPTKNNMTHSVPVRVIRGHACAHSYTGKVYTYDGLYKAIQYWAEKGVSGFTVFKYRLRRIEGHAILTTNQVQYVRAEAPKTLSELRGLVCDDISGGQEKLMIPASNLVDNPPLPPEITRFCRN